MKCASLFSGIGGFDLAAEWMGWETLMQCEINPFSQTVLRYYWPDAELFEDITKTDFTKYAGLIDLLTGGFPCQPYSVAGQRKGTEDERHLWPHMLRAVREIRPRWVVGENVRGLVSWNGGLVFDEVQSDLEAEGYKVLPFLLPACAVDAPHKRERIWFVAYNATNTTDAGVKGVREQAVGVYGQCVITDTASELQQRHEPGERRNERRQAAQPEHRRADTEFTGAVGKAGVITDTPDNGHERQPRRCADRDERGLLPGELRDGCKLVRNGKASAYSKNLGLQPTGGTWERWTGPENGSSFSGKASAYPASAGLQDRGFTREQEFQTESSAGVHDRPEQFSVNPHPHTEGLQGRQFTEALEQGDGGQPPPRPAAKLHKVGNWQNFPTEPPVCSGDDGLSARLDASAVFNRACKPGHAKPFPKWRNESIKGYGNAIVPQVVLQIYKAIEMWELMY